MAEQNDEATKPSTNEVATIQGGRDVTRGYVDSLGVLPPQDSILTGRGGGDYKIYEELLRDGRVASAFQQRRLAVVKSEWEVEPGGDAPLDVAAADDLREQLARIRFDAVTNKMLFGLFYGFAVGECLYRIEGARVVLDAIKVRKQRRFRFAPDGTLRLLTSTQPLGEALPPRKFWTFSTGADNDDEPYGLGLGYWLYWPVYFKRASVKFWLIFLEKFGTPTAMGEYPPSATEEEKARLLEALAAIQTDAGIIKPQGMLVSLLEAQRSGNVDQQSFVAAMNSEITQVILSQTMTTDDGSSQSQAEVHMDVRQEVVKSDGDLICESFNASVARWLTEWNFPGAKPPKVWRKLDNLGRLKVRAELDKLVAEAGGVRPSLRYLQQTYGGEWEPAPRAAPAPAFAESEPSKTDAVDAFADQLDERARDILDGLVDEVKRAVVDSSSFAELSEKLEKLRPKLDTGDFAALLQRAFAAAELAGRGEVDDGG